VVLPLLSAFMLGALVVRSDETEPEGEADSTPEKETWNVEAPPGDSYEITLDTDEGTWLDVDVSPDGSQAISTCCRSRVVMHRR
jgi:hypothetical protein